MIDEKEPGKYGAKDFASDVGRGLLEEGKTWLRWIGWGAAIGLVLGGVGGLYLAGTEGLAFGALGGLAVGAVAGLLLYFFLSTGGF